MFTISIHSLYPEILLFENIKHCVLENSPRKLCKMSILASEREMILSNLKDIVTECILCQEMIN